MLQRLKTLVEQLIDAFRPNDPENNLHVQQRADASIAARKVEDARALTDSWLVKPNALDQVLWDQEQCRQV